MVVKEKLKMMTVTSNEKTFNAWKIYHGLYLHFFNDYDYHKYGGKGPWNNINSMEKSFSKYERNGKYSAQRSIFEDLGKQFTEREDLIFFYLSQFTNNINYPSEFDSDLYDEYKERMNNFHFHLKRDTEEIIKYMDEYCKTFDELFVAEKVNHPPILKLGLSRTISLETFTTLDIILNFLPQMEKKLIDPASKDFIKLIRNYKPFLSINVEKEKKIIMDVLTKG